MPWLRPLGQDLWTFRELGNVEELLLSQWGGFLRSSNSISLCLEVSLATVRVNWDDGSNSAFPAHKGIDHTCQLKVLKQTHKTKNKSKISWPVQFIKRLKYHFQEKVQQETHCPLFQAARLLWQHSHLPDSAPRSSVSLSLSTMSLCFSMSAKDWP